MAAVTSRPRQPDKEREARLRKGLANIENTLAYTARRSEEAVERFKKENPSKAGEAWQLLQRAHDRIKSVERPKKSDIVAVDKAAERYEAILKLEAAQIGIRATLGHNTWFFENESRLPGAQTADEYKLHKDSTGLFEARAVIEAAKNGDQFARRALHNKLAHEIDDDLPILGEYKKYLLWLLWKTREGGPQEGKPRKGRHPRLNHYRDKSICAAVSAAISHGFRLTRNRASDGPSAASLVADALAEFGIHMTEANVELIAKNVPKKSEE